MKCFAISLGCPKNRVDTERALGSLSINIEMVEAIEKADLVFINTCAFIQPAIEETIRTIVSTIEDIKNIENRPLLAVAGCLLGRFRVSEIASDLPEVDIWLAPRELEIWPALLSDKLKIDYNNEKNRLISTLPSYAWLKIGEGCKHSCAFCTIPSIRGKHVSLDKDFIISEAQKAVAQGVKEIILVAQDVSAWEPAGSKKADLRPLLDQLLEIEELAWLRLMYLYPAGLTDELLEYMSKASQKLLPYFDVPLQHAHPDILKTMGRPFSKNPYEVIEKIRSYIPKAALRTSLIVGYPGETEEHFQALYSFVGTVKFHNMGVFSYYAEENTLGAKLPDQVENKIKDFRKDTLMELQAEISEELLTQYLGTNMEILVDSRQNEWEGLYLGRTWFQAPEVDGITYISGEHVKPGVLINGDIIETKEYDLIALA